MEVLSYEHRNSQRYQDDLILELEDQKRMTAWLWEELKQSDAQLSTANATIQEIREDLKISEQNNDYLAEALDVEEKENREFEAVGRARIRQLEDERNALRKNDMSATVPLKRKDPGSDEMSVEIVFDKKSDILPKVEREEPEKVSPAVMARESDKTESPITGSQLRAFEAQMTQLGKGAGARLDMSIRQGCRAFVRVDNGEIVEQRVVNEESFRRRRADEKGWIAKKKREIE